MFPFFIFWDLQQFYPDVLEKVRRGKIAAAMIRSSVVTSVLRTAVSVHCRCSATTMYGYSTTTQR